MSHNRDHTGRHPRSCLGWKSNTRRATWYPQHRRFIAWYTSHRTSENNLKPFTVVSVFRLVRTVGTRSDTCFLAGFSERQSSAETARYPRLALRARIGDIRGLEAPQKLPGLWRALPGTGLPRGWPNVHCPQFLSRARTCNIHRRIVAASPCRLKFAPSRITLPSLIVFFRGRNAPAVPPRNTRTDAPFFDSDCGFWVALRSGNKSDAGIAVLSAAFERDRAARWSLKPTRRPSAPRSLSRFTILGELPKVLSGGQRYQVWGWFVNTKPSRANENGNAPASPP